MITWPVKIKIHSKRYRLTDADGGCSKFVIDSLVSCGVLPDDSPKYVREVTHSQEKISKAKDGREETIITLTGRDEMTKILIIEQCYFCPFFEYGTSNDFQKVGWCRREEKSLKNTMIETEKDTWMQTIPDWCPLEDKI